MLCFPLSPRSQSLLPPLVHCPAIMLPGFDPCSLSLWVWRLQPTVWKSIVVDSSFFYDKSCWSFFFVRQNTVWQGSRDGAVARALAFHQCGPGSIPGSGVICGLSLLLVLVLFPRVFLRVLRFSSLHKNQHFQVPIRPERQAFTPEPLARETRRLLPTL